MMISSQYTRRVGLAVAGGLCVSAFTFLPSVAEEKAPTGTSVDWAIYVLDHDRWYQSADYWSAKGWQQAGLPEFGPRAIAGRELSALLTLLATDLQDSERNEYLEKYVTHHNAMVGRAALSKLRSVGAWTTAEAADYARRQGWDVAEYQGRASQVVSKKAVVPPYGVRPIALTQMPDRQSRDRLAEAIRILDHRNWYESDSGIARVRVAIEGDPANTRATLDRSIRHREAVAIGTIIDSDMPVDKMRELLTKYLEHYNDGVALQSLVALVSSGMLAPKLAVVYVDEHDRSVGAWHRLLASLPNATPLSVRNDVARRLLGAARDSASVDPPGSRPVAEIDAVRVLLASDDERDRTLIRWAAQQYRDCPMLWAAVSRLPGDERTSRLARKIYGDTARPLAVRCAAALVFGKSDAQIMGDVVDHILSGVRQFGCKEHVDWTYQAWSRPADPTRKNRLLRAKAMEGLLSVVYEIPDRFLAPHMAVFVEYPYMTLGAGVCTILARRLPHEFVQSVSKLHSVPRELYGPLVIASHYQPDVANRVKRILPAAEQPRVDQPIAEQGPEVVGMRALTLWD